MDLKKHLENVTALEKELLALEQPTSLHRDCKSRAATLRSLLVRTIADEENAAKLQAEQAKELAAIASEVNPAAAAPAARAASAAPDKPVKPAASTREVLGQG